MNVLGRDVVQTSGNEVLFCKRAVCGQVCVNRGIYIRCNKIFVGIVAVVTGEKAQLIFINSPMCIYRDSVNRCVSRCFSGAVGYCICYLLRVSLNPESEFWRSISYEALYHMTCLA